MSHAIAAVNRTKQTGRNSYQFYTPEMNAQAFERMVFEASLRRAMDRGEFLLHYQPQVEVQTGRVVGAEALLRWRHPEFGVVMPARFIPMLEENGLIVRVGEWVLRTACSDAKRWRDAGLPRKGRRQPLRAPVQPRGPHRKGRRRFARYRPRRAQSGARAHGELDHGRHAKERRDARRAQKTSGIKLAIDDFGTGYYSLSYLKRFPLDILKIDQSFVRDIATDPADAAIVAAIINLAHNLDLRVIAEGVETGEQLAYLREKGCDEIQGYFSRPCDA